MSTSGCEWRRVIFELVCVLQHAIHDTMQIVTCYGSFREPIRMHHTCVYPPQRVNDPAHEQLLEKLQMAKE